MTLLPGTGFLHISGALGGISTVAQINVRQGVNAKVERVQHRYGTSQADTAEVFDDRTKILKALLKKRIY